MLALYSRDSLSSELQSSMKSNFKSLLYFPVICYKFEFLAHSTSICNRWEFYRLPFEFIFHTWSRSTMLPRTISFYFFTQLCTPMERKRYQLSNFWASLNTTQISWFLKTSLSIKNLLHVFVNHFWLKKWTTVTSSLMFEVWAKYQTKH